RRDQVMLSSMRAPQTSSVLQMSQLIPSLPPRVLRQPLQVLTPPPRVLIRPRRVLTVKQIQNENPRTVIGASDVASRLSSLPVKQFQLHVVCIDRAKANTC